MSVESGKALFWAPRILSILLILLLSVFALDVFDEHLGFWRTMAAVAMHLIPSIVLVTALIVAWRREWVGTVLYAAAGLLYVLWASFRPLTVPLPVRLLWMLTLAAPAFVIAGLFLFNWKKHDELRALLQ